MTTQNVAPTAFPPQKSMDLSQTGPKDGHSVTKRLQQDLMMLVVRYSLLYLLINACSVSKRQRIGFQCSLVSFNRCLAILPCPLFPTGTTFFAGWPPLLAERGQSTRARVTGYHSSSPADIPTIRPLLSSSPNASIRMLTSTETFAWTY